MHLTSKKIRLALAGLVLACGSRVAQTIAAGETSQAGKDADKKWSGGVVLQSPIVKADRKSPEEGAPVLRGKGWGKHRSRNK